ncbi:hypothetical protein AVANS_0736 [Campylobacter sp. RM5004]|uniref:hypothetical protein n=1 Tax=Campylobacter sp. RM5004 TaxID=1660078 RepID=UPI001EFBB425|nr:hypothetical protein [Campylobacter sp. RM5004]ULO01366.1 hypothetical protein AVANS_0736 [Campylobacter sp. RM5004]
MNKERIRERIRLIDIAIDEVLQSESLADPITSYTIDGVVISKKSSAELVLELERLKSTYANSLKVKEMRFILHEVI